MSEREPVSGDGDQHGAGPAEPQAPQSKWLCCCCGEPVAADAVIDIVQDGSRLTGLTVRGRAMMALTIDGALETTVAVLDYADALRLVEEFGKRQLVVARHVEDSL
jgi:hypothetical protein